MTDRTKKSTINVLEQFLKSINDIPRKQATLLVGIDGCGGAGKTTFANKIKEECPNVTIVHMDDFHLPPSQRINEPPHKKPIGSDLDWKRLLNQVLIPISHDQEGYYQRYDWEMEELAEWHTVPIGGMVIIEGVYSIRKELANKYDFKLWVECPRETRLSRGLDRDGEVAREMWENNWMVSEDLYVEKHKPFDYANLVVSGTK